MNRPTFPQRVALTAVRRLHRWKRGMTMGARIAVFDQSGAVLLVLHSYAPGWILPGGGVEWGETCEEAAIRELREEAGVVPEEPLHLHGIFSNHASYRGDHLAIYVLRKFSRLAWSPSREISAAQFFAMDALPPSINVGSRRRINEIVTNSRPDTLW